MAVDAEPGASRGEGTNLGILSGNIEVALHMFNPDIQC